ncbi:MAG: ABC transporter permease subunit [Methylobacteriaceae bacterium]|jgi:polar amino acid transport system permease protein|nr:ABC transporter permease subunit [Methylobacteriaceae bacterium]
MEHSYWSMLSFGDTGWGDEFLSGFWLTLEISFCAYCVSFVFGLLGAAAKLGPFRALRAIGTGYTGLVRSLPELLLLLLLYYVVANHLEILLRSSGLVSETFQVSPFLAAVFALAFVCGAFMTEVLRAAYISVPAGQTAAGRALGLSTWQIQRFVIFPQLIRAAVPGMGNLWLAITKESALVSILGNFHEVLYAGYRAAANTKEYIFFYTFTALIFLFITIVSMIALRILENRLNRGFE